MLHPYRECLSVSQLKSSSSLHNGKCLPRYILSPGVRLACGTNDAKVCVRLGYKGRTNKKKQIIQSHTSVLNVYLNSNAQTSSLTVTVDNRRNKSYSTHTARGLLISFKTTIFFKDRISPECGSDRVLIDLTLFQFCQFCIHHWLQSPMHKKEAMSDFIGQTKAGRRFNEMSATALNHYNE